jgi:hypothetical protein
MDASDAIIILKLFFLVNIVHPGRVEAETAVFWLFYHVIEAAVCFSLFGIYSKSQLFLDLFAA